ncbi:TVP38/TMEM64 family protein [Niveispirillum irakense]|uniref:TVP38/TMEM64 family protein n=1 Tax=Niveispirillum irakense TaxID=34011 RepID=UPI0003FCA894|nr:TVP38/TMEM64 family protein [Niveispirillum irakense]
MIGTWISTGVRDTVGTAQAAARTVQAARAPGSARRLVLRVGAGILVIIAIALAWALLPVGEWMGAFREWINGFGWWAPLAFAVAYIISTLAMVPGAPMTMVAGLVFGLWGLPLVVASATVGSALAFLSARYLAHERIDRMIEQRPKLKAVARAVAAKGWTVITLLRLSPLIPFNMQNYLLGVTRLSFGWFLLATVLGSLPGSLLFVYIGMAGRPGAERGFWEWVMIGIGLAATVLVAIVIANRARRELRAIGLEEGEDEGFPLAEEGGPTPRPARADG